jgi:hypothetical protein
MKQTLKERIVNYITSLGFEPYLSRIARYECYRKVNNDGVGYVYYFLGNSGAVRASRDGNITGAVSISDTVRKKMEAFEERKQLAQVYRRL